MKCLNLNYDELFINSSKLRLKAKSLYNGNSFLSIPFGHAVYISKTSANMRAFPDTIKYAVKVKYLWQSKAFAVLLGMQLRSTKYCCFLCMLGSRDRKLYCIQANWSVRKLDSSKKSIVAAPLMAYKMSLQPCI